jgi:7-cyano-7-deazaguanine reductase
MPTGPNKTLETFDNPHRQRDYIIAIEIPEFTCLCPKTGQPDFATLYLQYVPDQKCIELKSLKLYIWSYRNEGAFHEDVTNTILNDLLAATKPRYMRLRARFNVRGGLYTTVIAEHRRPGWTPPPPPPDYLPPWPEAVLPVGTHEVRTETAPAPLARIAHERTQSIESRKAPVAKPRRSAGAEQPKATHTVTPAEPTQPAMATPSPSIRDDAIYLGVDLDMTACRAVAVDGRGELLADAHAPIPAPLRNEHQVTQDPTLWWKAVNASLQALLSKVDARRVRALAVDGTSGTVLLCDERGRPSTPALMCNDTRANILAEHIRAHCTVNSGAADATSSLAKLLWLKERKMDAKAAHVLHQADWVVGRLSGQWGHSDYHNSVRLGFDVENNEWPTWLAAFDMEPRLLPVVHAPGELIGVLSAESARTFGLPPDTRVVAGTTAGVAAFLAGGATMPGQGVTVLRDALSLRLLANKPVFSPEHGVYSHRLGRFWLAGGTSNTGWQVLSQYFDRAQVAAMSAQLDAEHFTGLDYYPLAQVGERFPLNDPNMVPRLEPLPSNSATFLQAMLEGMGHIEAQGYQLLMKLGAPALKEVFTVGPGNDNPAWLRIRSRILGVATKAARHGIAAYGTALLAAGVIAQTYSGSERTGTSG